MKSRRKPARTPDDDARDARLFQALADGTRRRLLDLLREQPRTTSELCTGFEISRYAIMKHLKVLEAAGLLLVERRGRKRMNHLNPVPLQTLYRRWLRPFEALPAERLLRLKELTERGKRSCATD